jgi:F-type H+-transporting ATPase subunit b
MIADLQRQLGIDASFFSQFLIFIFVFLWLRAVFFRPYLELIQRRQGQSEGLSDQASKLEEEASRAELEYADALKKARNRAAAERERLVADARKEANTSVDSSRREAKVRLDQARETAAKNFESDLAGLKTQVGSVASLLVEKLTKTKVGL